jgi:pSer/pThr/pTyr-binding forkhead associated (FHA) protein
MKNYAMRFISGKYQGGEFPLPPNAEILIGRSSELDMVLVEDMVSRRHARISMNGDQVTIEDLGSTNGTFVNGERVKRMSLSDGDRVLIGTSIIKLVSVDPNAMSRPVPAPRRLEEVAEGRRTTQQRSMSGAIDEVPVPDLLQLFASSRKTGVLVVRTNGDVGKVFLEKGTIAHATINDSPKIAPQKAVHRILAWRRGQFTMDPSDQIEVAERLELSVELALMEGMRIVDEVNRVGLPAMHSEVEIPSPIEAPLSQLTPEQLEVFQTCMQRKELESVFNNCPLDDLKIAAAIKALIDGKYIDVIEPLDD